MAANDLNFADLDALVALIKAGGVRSCHVDPAKINAPGVLVDLQTVGVGNLVGLRLAGRLLLIAASSEYRVSTKQLQELFNKVRPVLEQLDGPNGATTVVQVTLPGSQSPLPALAVPFDLLTTQE